MTEAVGGSSSANMDRLTADGWLALGDADWNTARSRFQQALEIGEHPRALEGLGMAAWWLDDAEAAFGARERAYRLYRDAGDLTGAARLASLLAMDYGMLRGEAAIANGWAARAVRLLEGAGPTPEAAFLALQQGIAAIDDLNDTAGARRCGQEVMEIGRTLGSTDLEMAGLALEGIGMVSDGEVADGMRRLDEATAAATAGDMSDPLMMGLAWCYMMFACERVRDFERAAEWCERIKAYCREVGLTFLLSICRAHYAAILTHWGEWGEAEEELSALTDEMSESFPGLAHQALVRFGELRRRQGRMEEAAELFVAAHQHAFAQLGLAAVALDRGDVDGAARRVGRFLRQVPASNVTERVEGIELSIRVDIQRGHIGRARDEVATLRDLADAADTPLLHAARLQAQGLVDAAAGEDERARAALEDAVDLYQAHRAGFEETRARLDLAGVLSRSRPDEAAAMAETARSIAERQGAGQLMREAEHLAFDLQPRSPGRYGLTDRELEVLQSVAMGLTTRKIADELLISHHTVKRHVANILTKLGVSSRAAAVAEATRRSLL